MSRKTVIFRRKLKQVSRIGGNAYLLIPGVTIKSTGRTTIYGQADTMDEDGRPQREGKRYPGRASDSVVTEPMDVSKSQRLLSLK